MRLEVLLCAGTACLSSGSQAVKRALIQALSAHGLAQWEWVRKRRVE
ncbi:(2Fe-2S) ferredoxin domain-containing protein [Candidatus Bipolaricaulota bacterium]|nr:(2Fe-2S) ferredoxin domain-containing protein [Candidatus Bipolaricaulota bacterium]